MTRKISRAVAAIKLGRQNELYLGNLSAIRDWGYAPEYVESMWTILQQDKPEDYVVATGVGATVEDFARVAFDVANLDYEKYIRFDEKYLRATEVNALVGDSSKAERELGWKAKTHWKELAKIMVTADIAVMSK